MADISRASDAEVLNTGTPDEAKFNAALACARISGAEGRPVVIDPRGRGRQPLAAAPRARAAGDPRAGHRARQPGGSAGAFEPLRPRAGLDSPERASEDERAATARVLAAALGRSVLLTGPQDIAAGPDGTALRHARRQRADGLCDGHGLYALRPLRGLRRRGAGHDRRRRAGLAFWKLCAARAEENAAGRGPGSFRAALLDAAWAITAGEFHTACGGGCRRVAAAGGMQGLKVPARPF